MPRTLGIVASTVSADYLNARMLTKPGSENLGSAVRKQIDWLAFLQVDQYSAIALAFALRQIVHSDNQRGNRNGKRSQVYQTQDGGSAPNEADSLA